MSSNSFANFMRMINPVKHPASIVFNHITYLKNGKPNWSSVPLNTPVKFYVTRKGGYSTRKTSLEIKGVLISKILKTNPERPYEFEVRMKNFNDVQDKLRFITGFDFFINEKVTLFYDELRLDLPND